LINLLASIEPNFVDWKSVSHGENFNDKKKNAEYAISLARKLGAVILC